MSPIPPDQCCKIWRFFQQKGKKSSDYQHLKWGGGGGGGGGENTLGVPALLSGIIARAVDVIMARTKRIYILMVKVNRLFPFFARSFLKEIENVLSVFLSF